MKHVLRDARIRLRIPRSLSVSIACLALALPAEGAVRVLESDATRVLLEIVPGAPVTETVPGAQRDYVRVTMPGMGWVDELGRPEVPIGSARVAVPPGKVPRLRVVRQTWSEPQPGAIAPVPERVGERDPFGVNQVVERPREEGPAYRSVASWPDRPFGLSELRNLRGLNVVSVVYHGVVADVFARRHRVLRSAVLEVTFEEDRSRAQTRLTRPAPADRLWDRTVAGTVVNADRARGWARGGPGDASLVGDAPWGGGTHWKVEITGTGIAELGWDALAAAGFPSGVPIDDVHVYQRTFDLDHVDDPAVAAPDLFVPVPVPVTVEDRNSNGTFDSGDGLLLYGLSFRDRWMTSPYEHEDKYDDRNFVWVRVAPGGARMPVTRPGGSLSGNPADSLASTPSLVHREEDRRLYRYPPDQKVGQENIEAEIYYWNDSRTPSGGVDPDTGRQRGWTLGEPTSDPNRGDPFEIVDLVPGSEADLRVRVIGGGGGGSVFGTVHRPNTCILWFYVNGDSVGDRSFYNNALFTGLIVHPDSSLNDYVLPGGLLQEGTNHFNLRGFSYKGQGTSVDNFQTRFFLDWYEVTYPRRLIARGDRFRMDTSTGAGGNVLARIEGFSGDDIRLFDVTDPLNPARVDVAPAQIVPAGGGFDLRFDHDNGSGPAAFYAIRDAAIPQVPAGRVTAVQPPSALAGGVGARYVVVSHPSFLGGAQELASWRSTRYTAHAVDVTELYDVFRNGGRHPEAMKMFSTYAFHRWSDPIALLCLVGDASEDHRGLTADSDPDFLPSQGLYADYEGIAEDSDQYFAEVTRPAPGTLWDDLSDIYVGRITAGTPEELDWNLQRIRAYETDVSDDLWRRRVLVHADDRFSGSLGGGFGDGYGWRSEQGFQNVSEDIDSLLATHAYDKLTTDKLYMSHWSHPCPDSCYGSNPPNCEAGGLDCGFWYECRDDADWNAEYLCMRVAMREAALPVLRDKLESGALIWNFQGHANRFFMTHEVIFADDPTITGHTDVGSLKNFGKPFVFFGFACHLAEFDVADERVREDCLSEKLMNLRPLGTDPPGGAVGVFASSGFEFLNANLLFNRLLMHAFFFPEHPDVIGVGGGLPDGPVQGGAYRWTLGESTLRARLMFQESYPNQGTTRQAAQRFVLLGDPAVEPSVGGAGFSVAVNGEEVSDGQFLGLGGVAPTMRVEARAQNGRGVVAMRVTDSSLGAIPPTSYTVAAVDTTEHGVVQTQLLTYEAPVRAEDYDVVLEAEDGGGVKSTFTMRLRNNVEIENALAYPNPFERETKFYFVLTTSATARADLYTINGRRIWTKEIAASPDRNAIAWDGRDEDGTVVANGTYFVRIKASGANSAEVTFPVVKMR